MATTWNPLAVALVSSGSRGNKLLFYHSGVSQSQTLEKELLSKLPQRTLAEILAPSGVMIGKKFELRVDEWKFVGHPFTLQQPLMTASFNIVFILQSVCSTDVVKCYENLSHILGVAALHEEERTEFLKNQVSKLIQVSEEADTIQELSEKAVSCSSLAKTLWEVLCGLQDGDLHVNVQMNEWSKVSYLINVSQNNEISPIRNRTVRSYSAVILLSNTQSINTSLPSLVNPSFQRFLFNLSPVKSLSQVSLDADLPLHQAMKFTSHLVYWKQAMTIYPLSETNVYVNSSNATINKDSQTANLFAEEFPDIGSLCCVLFHFSSPITLAEMKDLYSDEKLIPVVTWLLKHDQIIQLHTYVFIVPPLIDDSMFDTDNDSNKLFHVSDDILKELEHSLSQEELSWVMSVDASSNEEDLTLFAKLSCYFHGNHHLEEILMLQNMTRSQLLSLIDKFSEILTTVLMPEHCY